MIKSTIVLVAIVLVLVVTDAWAAGVIDALKANLKDKLKPAYQNHYPTGSYGSSPHYVESPSEYLNSGYGAPYSGSRSHYAGPVGSAYSPTGPTGHASSAYNGPYGAPTTHTSAYGAPAGHAYGTQGGYGALGGYGHQRHHHNPAMERLYDEYEEEELPYGHSVRNSHLRNPYRAGYQNEYADYPDYSLDSALHEPAYMGHHGGYPGIRRPRFRGAHQVTSPSVSTGGAAASSAAAGAGGAAASAAVAAGGTGHIDSHPVVHPEMMHGSGHSSSLDHLDADMALHHTEPYLDGFSASSSEHIEHEEPEVNQSVSASAGTFTTDDQGVERTSYQRSTEHVQNEEKGHVDDDHYYNAQSYGKTHDDNLHEAFDKDDEDYEQTATGFRKKKRKENYVKTHNKATRETGSGVVAKDKHRAGFKKSSNKFIENVDQKTHREGAGILEKEDSNTSQHIDDEDEDFYNSDGLHAGHDNKVFTAEAARGAGAAGAGAAAASAVAGAAGVASSASAASASH